MSPRVFALSHDLSLTERLGHALEGLANVTRVDPGMEAFRQLAASVRPDLVVVDFAADSSEFTSAIGLVRHVQHGAPGCPVIAIGEVCRADVVLAAVRAGARDFVDHGSALDALQLQIVPHLDRAGPRVGNATSSLTVITSGQPNDGEGLFAVNYAATQAKHGRGDTLLLDFHLPTTIAGPALDLGLNYTVRDAVHDLVRLDRTLLSSVLGHHRASGLYVLPLALGAKEAVDVSGDAIVSLLATLRGVFANVTVNLAGLQHAELLTELLNEADKVFLVSSQHFTSVKACRDLLALLPAPDARITLVVDDYDTAIALSDAQMRTALGLPRSVRLPRARAALANCANRGVPLVLDQPRSQYGRMLEALVGVRPRAGVGTLLRRWKPAPLPVGMLGRPVAGST